MFKYASRGPSWAVRALELVRVDLEIFRVGCSLTVMMANWDAASDGKTKILVIGRSFKCRHKHQELL